MDGIPCIHYNITQKNDKKVESGFDTREMSTLSDFITREMLHKGWGIVQFYWFSSYSKSLFDTGVSMYDSPPLMQSD